MCTYVILCPCAALNEVLTFTPGTNSLCRPFNPMDNEAVSSDVSLVIQLNSTDRAVSDLGTAAAIVRDDDSKYNANQLLVTLLALIL